MQKTSKIHQRMQETIGIDLGDRLSRYCIVDRDGNIVEEGSFRNQASSIQAHFGGEPRRIALKAGAQSAWISRELKQLGHEVIGANPRELKWIAESDTKNDSVPRDARKLAMLARADIRLWAPVEHRGAEQQTELALIRACDAILRARTLLVKVRASTVRASKCARRGQEVRRAPAEVDRRDVRPARRRCGPGVSAPRADGLAETD